MGFDTQKMEFDNEELQRKVMHVLEWNHHKWDWNGDTIFIQSFDDNPTDIHLCFSDKGDVCILTYEWLDKVIFEENYEAVCRRLSHINEYCVCGKVFLEEDEEKNIGFLNYRYEFLPAPIDSPDGCFEMQIYWVLRNFYTVIQKIDKELEGDAVMS